MKQILWVAVAATLVGCGGETPPAPLSQWTCTVGSWIPASGVAVEGRETHTWILCGTEGADADWVESCVDHASSLMHTDRAYCECALDSPPLWDCPEPGARFVWGHSYCGSSWAPSESNIVCDDYCVSTQLNPDHCGGCGMRCASGQVCRGGTCLDCYGPPDHCRVIY